MAKIKREKTDFETKAYKAFDGMPIEKWWPFIEKEAKDEKELRAYKLIARRSLNIENMMDYIKTYHNTAEDKKAFKKATYGPKYLKENKKFVYDADGKKIPEKDESGNPITVQSVVFAVEYFINKYFPQLAIEKKEPSKAFDALKDW